MSPLHAMLLLLSCVGGIVGQRGGTCEDPDADVLIMGAGMAGISAAKMLYDSGIRNFLILEGTNRIGGRMRSTEFSGMTVELGANWIQGVPEPSEPPGQSDNPIWQLANGDCPLEGVYYDTESFLAFEGMVDVTDETTEAIANYYDADYIITKLSEERKSTNLPDISVREALLLNTSWNPSTNLEKLVDWYLFDFCYAEPPENTSLYQAKPLLTYENLGDYDYMVTDQDGFSSVVECIGREFLSNESIVKLNTNVRKIRWSDECVCAEAVQPEGPRTFCGSFGIVTFSIGVLQEWVRNPEEEPMFEPELPEEKTNTINAFSMAHYLKIFVNFTEVFWNTTVDNILHVDEQRGRFPVIVPLPLSQSDDTSNILLFSVVEEEATRILQQPENETREEIMQLLRGIYGDGIPSIDSIIMPHWYEDPFYLGSYSNIPVGVDFAAQREIASPDGRLYISGEVTDPDYSGFVHGAYLSGVATAQSVAEAIEAAAASPTPILSPSPTPSGQSTLSPPAVALLSILLVAVLLSSTIM